MKAAASATRKAEDTRIAEIVDQLGPLQRECQALELKQRQMRLLKAELEGILNQRLTPEESVVVEGFRYTAQVGARSIQRKVISNGHLYRVLGKANFLAVCNVPLKAIDENVPAEEHAKCVSSERSGHRDVRTFARVIEMAQQAA